MNMTHKMLVFRLSHFGTNISLEIKMELFNPKNWELFEFQFEQIILN